MGKWAWCLVNDDNTLSIGWNQIGDYWYYFYSNGQMACDEWLKLNNVWYRVNDKGQMFTGWWQDSSNSKWYYLEPESNGSKGTMYKNSTFSINGKSYTFNEDGSLIDNSLISDKLIDFVKSFEGFSATPYFDEVGVKTLGYGMTGSEIEGLESVTEEEATQMLKGWINDKYAPAIKSGLEDKGANLTQNEFDALVSMSYNVGTAGVVGSTLFKNVCAGVRDGNIITLDFQAWSKAGGQTLAGLYKRRTKEANMFLNADYTGNV